MAFKLLRFASSRSSAATDRGYELGSQQALARAMDSVDKHLLDVPNTPLGMSQFRHGNLETFDAAVRDLIQSQPDCPIGGYPASPMRRSMSLGIEEEALCSSRGAEADALMVPVTPSPCSNVDLKNPLEARSNFSNIPLSKSANPRTASPLSSELSLPMITAPQSPNRYRRSGSYETFDISGRDYGARPHGFPTIGECSAIPLCLNSGMDGMACCELGEEAEEIACCEFGAEEQGMQPCPLSKEDMCPGPHLCPARPSILLAPSIDSASSLDQENCPLNNSLPVPALPGLDPKAPQMDGSLLPPISQLAGVGGLLPPISELTGADGLPLPIPTDISGILTAPPTPDLRRSARSKNKVLRSIRRSRARCLRTPVLSVVIGRQLAGPTRTALKAIANMEVPDLSSISSIAPVPVPGLPSPVPISA